MARGFRDEDEPRFGKDDADDVEEIHGCTCISQTTKPNGDPKAILVKNDKGKEAWFPYSAIHDNSEVFEDGTTGTLIVKAWFARQKGFKVFG